MRKLQNRFHFGLAIDKTKTSFIWPRYLAMEK